MRFLSLLWNFFRLRRLAGERRGAMLVEFSLVLPGFFVVLLGGLTIADALSAYNKMQNVATTVGIMTSRVKTLSNMDMVGIAQAARGYMFPFPTDNLSILVAAVWVDGSGTPSILWCERWNPKNTMGGKCSGNVVAGNETLGYWETASNISVSDLKLTPGILNPDTGIVVVHSTYHWIAPYLVLPQFTHFKMTDVFFYSPRADVTLNPPTRDRDSPKPSSSFEVKQ
jgi:Flp pilus assembly protein TadG